MDLYFSLQFSVVGTYVKRTALWQAPVRQKENSEKIKQKKIVEKGKSRV